MISNLKEARRCGAGGGGLDRLVIKDIRLLDSDYMWGHTSFQFQRRGCLDERGGVKLETIDKRCCPVKEDILLSPRPIRAKCE